MSVMTRSHFIARKKLRLSAILVLLFCTLAGPGRCAAQDGAPEAPEASGEAVTVFPHSQTARWCTRNASRKSVAGHMPH